jgi:hypothetical protein
MFVLDEHQVPVQVVIDGISVILDVLDVEDDDKNALDKSLNKKL